MIKERVKSTVVILLIINSLFLMSKIWFSEKLWPSGYNFFVSWEYLPIVRTLLGRHGTYSLPKDSLSKPRKIVINDGSTTAAFYNSDEDFEALHGEVKNFLVLFLKGELPVKKQDTATIDEWFEALRIKSLYVEYPLAYTPKLFGQILGVSEAAGLSGVSGVKDFIIVPTSVSSEDEVVFYVRGIRNNEIIKYYVTYDGIRQIDSTITELAANTEGNYFFSFDLNLHSAQSASPVEQKVLIDPLVLISDIPAETPAIKSSNPLWGDNRAAVQAQILKYFEYNPQTFRKYVDSSQTLVFVENYSTLKLYRDGLIEYVAIDENKGIELVGEGKDSSSLYESLNAAIDFIEKVWSSAAGGKMLNVCVTSDLLENTAKPGVFRFTFDYYVEGLPVVVNIGGGSEEGIHAPLTCAVEIEMKHGRLTSYRHYMRDYTVAGPKKPNITMISALDGVYKALATPDEQVTISDIFLCYMDNGNTGEITANWGFKFKGSDRVIVY